MSDKEWKKIRWTAAGITLAVIIAFGPWGIQDAREAPSKIATAIDDFIVTPGELREERESEKRWKASLKEGLESVAREEAERVQQKKDYHACLVRAYKKAKGIDPKTFAASYTVTRWTRKSQFTADKGREVREQIGGPEVPKSAGEICEEKVAGGKGR